jgi:transposase
VELVAMDMWRPYKEAVNAVLPQATVVIDKFHVLRLANACNLDRLLS